MGNRLNAPTFAVVIALAAAALAGAQPQQAPQTGQPTFRSGVQLIEVDVRVFEKNGRFVADLTKDDFELLENGVPQRIDAMYLVGETVSRGAVGPAGIPTVPAPSGPLAPRPPGPPTPIAPQTWIFMFDLNHLTPGGGFERARKAVGDFIAHRFKEGDLAGIVAGEKMLNNRLTSVRQELVDSIKQVKPRSDARNRFVELTREWPRFLDDEEAIRVARYERDVVARVAARACAEQPDMCGRGDVDAHVRSKGIRLQQEILRTTNQTLAALNALASGLAKMAGPKTVVFLSEGFVVQDVETALRTVVGQTARAGGRVYAIDVRGLNRTGNAGIIDQALPEDPYHAVTKFDTLADGTNSLAVDTGGMMIRNENNIGRALDRIVDDAGQYYVLAYQPANTIFDGKFRPILVRVNRPGVRVRARRGYLALEPSKMLVPQPIKGGL